MTGVTITVHDQGRGIAPTQQFTYECHSPERLAEIVQGTFDAMADTARITRIETN